jgi:CRP/FNR family cyclic AMP-dependent transcriptional regulator
MVIVSGTVTVERDGAKINALKAGDFFGEIAVIDRGPRTATVTADTPCRLLVINHRDFLSLIDEFPEVASEVLVTLAHRLRGLDRAAIH